MPYSKKEIKEIVRLYKTANHNPREAERILREKNGNSPSHVTIKRIWKREIHDYTPNPHGGVRYALDAENARKHTLTAEEIRKIVKSFPKYKGKFSDNMYRLCWQAAGLIPKTSQMPKTLEERVQQALVEE